MLGEKSGDIVLRELMAVVLAHVLDHDHTIIKVASFPALVLFACELMTLSTRHCLA